MKPNNLQAKRLNARETLRRLNLSTSDDFCALRSAQVQALLVEADRQGYRQPRNANGSRGRYFFYRLVRLSR